MTVNEIYKRLGERIPSDLSCPWDNDGLMCCADGNRAVKKVLVTLDVTSDAVRRAIDGGFDLIVSHHPMIFKGLKAVNEENYIASKAIELIKNNISVMSFHTRLDAVCKGVNDTLATALGIGKTEPFGEEGIGRIGELRNETTLADFAETVKRTLSTPFVLCSDAGRPVRRVALLGGEGGDDIGAAIRAGADTFVSGRLGYHNVVDAPEMGINLIEAGHFYTEYPVCETLRSILHEMDGDLKIEIYNSNRIKAL